MDETELKAILSRIQAPEANEQAMQSALQQAMAVLDEKNAKKSQGLVASRRLNLMNNPFAWTRKLMMNNKMMWSGVTGGMAVAVVLGILGVPFLDDQMGRLAPHKQDNVPDTSSLTQKVVVADIAALESRKDVKKEAQAVKIPPIRAEKKAVAVASPAARIAQEVVVKEAAADRAVSRAPIPMLVQPSAAPIVTSDRGMPELPPPPVDTVESSRDNFQAFEQNGIKDVTTEPVSTFSIDVDTASYAFIRRQLYDGILPAKDAVRIEEMINYFDYAYDVPKEGDEPFKPTIAVYDAPWHAGHKIIHIGIKGFDIKNKPQSNLVFLIDTSGSMNEPNKLPLLKSSFKLMLETLSPDDTIAIVVYAGSAGTVLEPTKVSDKQKIIMALDSLQPGGGTAGSEGIQQAYALAEHAKLPTGNNRIILATDGDFNVGISDLNELKKLVAQQRDQGIFLSVLGFGQGNYNDQIMQTLAQNGNGNAAYIDNLNEARKVLVDEAKSTLFTIAKDVKIQVEFNPATVSEYRLIGYETRQLNREDFNNDTVDAGDVGSGRTVTALYEITPVGENKTVDDLRYGTTQFKVKPTSATTSNQNEYGFLKIRYKKPNGTRSMLMARPITVSDSVVFDHASTDVRFAASVAAFGEVLKNSPFAGTWTFDQVIATANAARGPDEFGTRTEFVNLVRLAKSASAAPIGTSPPSATPLPVQLQ